MRANILFLAFAPFESETSVSVLTCVHPLAYAACRVYSLYPGLQANELCLISPQCSMARTIPKGFGALNGSLAESAVT